MNLQIIWNLLGTYTYLDEPKIRKAEKFVEPSVLKLQSKTSVVKYSWTLFVAEANNVETVTIFFVKGSQKTVVSCYNTICQIQQGKKQSKMLTLRIIYVLV